MKKSVFIPLLIEALMCAGCVLTNQSTQPYEASLVEVLVNPKKLTGKRVTVTGFYHHEIESSAVYLSKDDAKFGVIRNAVWLGEVKSVDQDRLFAELNDVFIEVSGIVRHEADGVGHLRMFNVALEKIELVRVRPLGTAWKESLGP